MSRIVLEDKIERGVISRSEAIFECPEHDFDVHGDCEDCPAILGEDDCLPDRPDSHLIIDGHCDFCGESASDLKAA